jgi:hypothetical protein
MPNSRYWKVPLGARYNAKAVEECPPGLKTVGRAESAQPLTLQHCPHETDAWNQTT